MGWTIFQLGREHLNLRHNYYFIPKSTGRKLRVQSSNLFFFFFFTAGRDFIPVYIKVELNETRRYVTLKIATLPGAHDGTSFGLVLTPLSPSNRRKRQTNSEVFPPYITITITSKF